MTYTHALQYLSESSPAQEEKIASSPLFRACLAKTSRRTRRWFPIFLSDDRSGHATALFLSRMLQEAKIPFAHLIEGPDLPISERLLLNDAPILSTELSASCHHVRNMETFARRSLSRTADSSSIPPLCGVERCLFALQPIFEKSGCDVVLLEGDHRLPLLRTWTDFFREGKPGAVLISGAESVRQLPIGRVNANIISIPCGPEAFRHLSDACAQDNRQLCMIATTEGSRQEIAPASQYLDYRGYDHILLRCGLLSYAQYAMLALEGILLLRKYGLYLPDSAIRRGLSATWVPDYFQPRAIDPIVLCHRVEAEEDPGALLADLTELAPLLPQPRRLYTEPDLTAMLAPVQSLYAVVTEAEPISEGATVVLGRPEHLQRVASEWKLQRRAL